MARFGFDNMEDLPIGKTVAFAISGEDHERYGKVKDVHLLSAAGAEVSANSDARGLNNQGSVADVIVTIEPRESLDPSLINRPVDVRLGGETPLWSQLSRLGDRLISEGRRVGTGVVSTGRLQWSADT